MTDLMTQTWFLPTIIIALIIVIGIISFLWYRGKTGAVNQKKSETTSGKSTADTPLADINLQENTQTVDESLVGEKNEDNKEDEGESEKPLAQGSSIETVEAVESRLVRLRSRLAKGSGLSKALLKVFSRSTLEAKDWEEIEDTLLLADLGIGPTDELIEALKTEQRVRGLENLDQVREMLKDKLLELVDNGMDRSLKLDAKSNKGDCAPAIVLMVGVNGTGKTTTVGKLARILVSEEKTVLLGAADTFRAAAAQQLQTWGQRVGVQVVSSDKEGADPASVAFESVKVGQEIGVDVVIVDTAGRLQNKAGLMDELGKVKRVIEKQLPVSESLLVLDATTGQNGMKQAQVFAEVAQITGIVLTKLDGSAKGGIVVAVQRELGVPVKLVGLGEGPDDLVPFDSHAFVEGIIG